MTVVAKNYKVNVANLDEKGYLKKPDFDKVTRKGMENHPLQ
jgi:hypothetical protein